MKKLKLPKYWHHQHGWFSCRVPKAMRPFFEDKPSFMLSKDFNEAKAIYERRFLAWRQSEKYITVVPATVNQLIERYSIEVLPNKKPQSRLYHSTHFDKLRKSIGSAELKYLEVSHVYTLYDALKVKSGFASANTTMAILSHMLSYAVRWGSIKYHPMKMGNFRKEYPKKIPTNYIPPTDNELLEALQVADKTIYDYVMVKWRIGLRRTDMLQLRVENITDEGIVVTPSKTIDSTGVTILHEWDEAGELRKAIDRQLAGRNELNDFVFITKEGKPYIDLETKLAYGFQSKWRRWQTKAIKETKLKRKFVERSLRTKNGSDSGSLEEARIRLGHATDTTTSRHYRTNVEVSKPLQISLKKQA